ncbi:MAG: GNAT family N-acetyltransferase [Bacteroidota bacterium]
MKDIIQIDNNISLTKSSRADKLSLIRCLNDKDVSDTLLRIPFPYHDTDADAWYNYILTYEAENNIQKNWVIRNKTGELIGSIGLHYPYGLDADKNEIYYWLARPFWNKGIMTTVIKHFSDFCFDHLKYVRLEAPIFDFNIASEIVLKKNGFKLEATIPNHYQKADKFINAKMYIKTGGH